MNKYSKNQNVNSNYAWIIHEASKKELLGWNLTNEDFQFAQSREFAYIKESYGWKYRFLVAKKDDQKNEILVLERDIPILGRLWYVPCGPTPHDSHDFSDLIEAIYAYGEKFDVFLIKTEPRYIKQSDQTKIESLDDMVAQEAIQPPNTLLVSIQNSDNFESLGRRARRYSRQAKSDGVIVKKVPMLDSNCKIMYGLMSTANGGRGIPGQHSYDYYVNFWKTFHSFGTGDLYFAYENGSAVAGAYILRHGNTVTYKDGGSTSERLSRGATYLLHAEIINDHSNSKFTSYDMWGMPPSHRINDKSHPLYGIGQYKIAFSKNIIEYIGCYDYSTSDYKYWIWRNIVYKLIMRFRRAFRLPSFW